MRHPAGLAMINKALSHIVAIRKRIEAQEASDALHVIDAGRAMSALPIDHGCFAASDEFRHVNLVKFQVEASFTDHLANCLRVLGVFR